MLKKLNLLKSFKYLNKINSFNKSILINHFTTSKEQNILNDNEYEPDTGPILKNQSSTTTSFPQTNDPYLWLSDEDKNIFVMGIFHHEYTSVLKVQNTIKTFKPDAILIELCPKRGDMIFQDTLSYTDYWYYSSRDVESAAIICGQQLKKQIIYADIPEDITANKIEKINYDMAQKLRSKKMGLKEPLNMSKLKVFVTEYDNQLYPGDIIKWKDKDCIIDENGDKWDILTREGFRLVVKYDENLKNKEIKKILYDDREKNIIRKIIETDAKKIVCIVGMAHLDGIEKYWQDITFWEDKEFWGNIPQWELDNPQIMQKYKPKRQRSNFVRSIQKMLFSRH